MSKLSFRARQLDASKPMPVYRTEEIPDIADVAAINRAVPQMPTGMEKEEETEHHLQRALSAQQVYGTAEALVIPVPEIDIVEADHKKLYKDDYKIPRSYIHVQSLGVDQEIPDYDMDSEDELWLNEQAKKMEITSSVFEEMIDRLEKGSGQQVVTLQEAKLLLKEDDDLIITVYDYWLNKRLKLPHTLVPTVKTEKRDGSTTNNPYVAFRRRTEKMQTRKNRKNDEVSYEKMLKLRRDLCRAVTLLEMIKKREKSKKELLQLTIEILDKRYDMEDFSGTHLNYAESQKTQRPVFYPLYDHSKDGNETSTKKQKREYKKRKHKSGGNHPSHFTTDVDVTEYLSSDDEPLSPGMSVSDQEEEDHPDGIYAFRRKKFCNYHAPLDTPGSWAWHGRDEGGLADKRFRYSLTTVNGPQKPRCLGFARRRMGRGGRIIFDRAMVEENAHFWDRAFDTHLEGENNTKTFQDHIKDHKWLHFAPSEEYDTTSALFNGELIDENPADQNIDCLMDPILDVSEPEPVVPNSFAPIVTAPVTVKEEPTLKYPLAEKPTTTTLTVAPKTEVKSGVDEVMITNFESHQKHLIELKKSQQEQMTRNQSSSATDELDLSQSLVHSFGSKPSSVSLVDSRKAREALSALVNGHHTVRSHSSTTAGSNGLKSYGPISLVNLKQDETFSTSPSASVRKLNYPLTPSSDTSESVVNHLSDVHLPSLPGESGDSVDSKSLLPPDIEYIDTTGLNNMEVASTMEVS